ncbi:hypothetical protein [Kitasatospora cineracea]|uniref:hypothetical protein n=1 Tax=Kitasatospora cineracea TaxID=88074 RepID=UPI001FCA3FDF|nr:hypothetical protein [Kitasatospora cineracea]
MQLVGEYVTEILVVIRDTLSGLAAPGTAASTRTGHPWPDLRTGPPATTRPAQRS